MGTMTSSSSEPAINMHKCAWGKATKCICNFTDQLEKTPKVVVLTRWLWPTATLRHKTLERAASARGSATRSLFCLSYFTSFIGFYWQRDLNFSKRHLLPFSVGLRSSLAFGLIVSHFLWPDLCLEGLKQVASGYVSPHPGHNLAADCTFMAKSCSSNEANKK